MRILVAGLPIDLADLTKEFLAEEGIKEFFDFMLELALDLALLLDDEKMLNSLAELELAVFLSLEMMEQEKELKKELDISVFHVSDDTLKLFESFERNLNELEEISPGSPFVISHTRFLFKIENIAIPEVDDDEIMYHFTFSNLDSSDSIADYVDLLYDGMKKLTDENWKALLNPDPESDFCQKWTDDEQEKKVELLKNMITCI